MKNLMAFALLLVTTVTLNAQSMLIRTSDSVDLFVRVKGKGTPCLYIHGGPGSGSYWLEKFSGEFLEQHFQMIYLDQRGVSRSTSPTDANYSMDSEVGHVPFIENKADLEKAIINFKEKYNL